MGAGGHLGSRTRLEIISKFEMWKNMKKDVSKFCYSCVHFLETRRRYRIPGLWDEALHVCFFHSKNIPNPPRILGVQKSQISLGFYQRPLWWHFGIVSYRIFINQLEIIKAHATYSGNFETFKLSLEKHNDILSENQTKLFVTLFDIIKLR